MYYVARADLTYDVLADALIDAINNDIAETKRALELDEYSIYRQDSFLRD